MKSDFIHNITHELNTPISTIAVAVKNLGHESIMKSPQKLSDLAGVISRQNTRLQKMIDKVMKLSFLESNELGKNRTPVSAHQFLSGLLQDFRIRCENVSLTVSQDFTARKDTLFLDPFLFATALFNILDNAVKYSKEKPRIHVKTWDSGNSFFISVTDKGIGISKSAQKFIFDKFYRVTDGDLYATKGLGIGLYTSKTIIEAYEGRLTVSSRPGKGSEFVITLPMEKREIHVET